MDAAQAAPEGASRWPFAVLLACPACIGATLLGAGAFFGIAAIYLKSALLAVGVATVALLWGRNAWRRRNEDADCAVCLPEPASDEGTR